MRRTDWMYRIKGSKTRTKRIAASHNLKSDPESRLLTQVDGEKIGTAIGSSQTLFGKQCSVNKLMLSGQEIECRLKLGQVALSIEHRKFSWIRKLWTNRAEF